MLRNVVKNLITGPATRTTGRTPFAGARAKLAIDYEKCVFCGQCQRRCPAKALEVNRQAKSLVLRAEKCILCGFCVEGCPKGCLCMDGHFREPVTDRSALRQAAALQDERNVVESVS